MLNYDSVSTAVDPPTDAPTKAPTASSYSGPATDPPTDAPTDAPTEAVDTIDPGPLLQGVHGARAHKGRRRVLVRR